MSRISRQGSQLAVDAEGLDRHGRAAAPFDAVLERVRARGEILLDLAPDEGAVEQHVRAVRLVHQRAAGVGLLGIEHERQRLVLDRDRLGGVLGERARCRPPPRRPIRRRSAPLSTRQRIARHVRRIEAGRAARWSRRQAPRPPARNARPASPAPRDLSIETMRAAGCGQVTSATCLTPCGTISAAKLPLPTTKRRSSRTRRSDETKRNFPGALMAASAGWFWPRMRSAASAIASTICA